MKLIINVAPNLAQYVCVRQDGQILYDGKIPEIGIDISGVSDGKVEIGLDRYAIPLDVKANSAVIINDTRKSRWYMKILYGIFVSMSIPSLFALYIPMDCSVVNIIILCVAIVALVFALVFPYWYRNKPEKKYKVFIV